MSRCGSPRATPCTRWGPTRRSPGRCRWPTSARRRLGAHRRPGRRRARRADRRGRQPGRGRALARSRAGGSQRGDRRLRHPGPGAPAHDRRAGRRADRAGGRRPAVHAPRRLAVERMSPEPAASFTALAHDPRAPLDRLALALAAELRPVDADVALARARRARGASSRRPCRRTPGRPRRSRPARRSSAGGTGSVASAPTTTRPRARCSTSCWSAAAACRSCSAPSTPRRPVARASRSPASGCRDTSWSAHLGADPPLLLDPSRAARRSGAGPAPRPHAAVGRARDRVRMLNNLVAAYGRRADLGLALRSRSSGSSCPPTPPGGRR